MLRSNPHDVRCILLSLVLALVSRTADLRAAEFAALPLENTPSSIALSEDGETLFVAHRHADLVSVVETVSGRSIASIATRAPSSLMFRGNALLVPNDGEGTISIFAPANGGFELVNEVEVGPYEQIKWISAPQGPFYKDWILVTCSKSEHVSQLQAVNVATDKNHAVGEVKVGYGSATVSYDGKHYIEQDEPWGGGHILAFRDFPAAVRGEESESAPRGEGTPFLLHQVQPGPYWFGAPKIYKGQSPSPVAGEPLGRMTVPDSSANVCYGLEPESVRCFAVDRALTALGEQKTAFPPEYERMAPSEEYRPNQAQWQGYAVFDRENVAVTIDGKLCVYLLSGKEQAVYFSIMPAFDLSKAPAAETLAGEPDDPAEGANVGQLSAQSPIGKPIVLKLDVPAGAELELVGAPKTAALSSDRTLTWTPQKEDLGPQQIKIRMKVDGRTSFLRLKTDVVLAGTAVASVPSAPSASGRPRTSPSTEPPPTEEGEPTDFPFQPLHSTTVGMTYSLDGKSLLLIDGTTFMTLDASGVEATGTHEFDKAYRQIFERPEYYVALAAKSVDLIAKKSLEVKRSIDVDYAQLNSLAINPVRKVSYIGVMKPSEKDYIASKPVLEVNEETGEVRVLPEVYGMWLTVDPRGTRLVTGLGQIYKDEFTLSLRDEFSHLDVVSAYDLAQANPRLVSINEQPGKNGRRLVMSPDGKHASYVAGGGAGGYGYSIAALATDDVSRESSRYQIEAYPQDIAYNPRLNFVACTNGRQVWLFDRKTGEPLQDRLTGLGKMNEVERVFFSPSGDRLLIAHKSPQRGPVLEAVPFQISESERTAIEGTIAPAETASRPESESTERTWTDATGKFKIQAKLVEFADGFASLQRTDGTVVRVKATTLSEADRKYLQKSR